MPDLQLPIDFEQTLAQLQGVQNPQLTDLLAPDPAAAEREKQLWEKINKGPRQRSKEIEAEMWRDRYGVKEDSGKFRRFLAGLGETARGIAGREHYKSIPDTAYERGLKEYQTEVGPLQRELGVLQQAKNAAMSTQSKLLAQNADRDLKVASELVKAGKSWADVQKTLGKTPQEMQKIQESILKGKDIEAATLVKKQQAENLKKTLGLGGNAGLTMAQADMSPTEQSDINRVIFGNEEAKAFGRLSGSPEMFKTTTPGGTKTTTSETVVPAGVGVNGLQLFEKVPRTTTSQTQPKNIFDPKSANVALDAFKQKYGLIQDAVKAGNSADSPIAVFENKDGSRVAYQKTPTPPKVDVTLKDGQTVAITRVNPLVKENLSPYFPSADWTHPDANPRAYASMARITLPKKEMTSAEKAEQAAIDMGKRLASTGMREFVNGGLEDISGPAANIKGGLKRMFGRSATGQTFVNADAKDLFSKYALAMTGKSSNPTETKRFQDVMPSTSDNEITFMQKALRLMSLASQTEWMNGLNLKGEMRSKLMNNKNLLDAPQKNTEAAFRHLTAAQKARKMQQKTYQLPGDPEVYNTNEADKLAWTIVSETANQMQNFFWEEYPDGNGIAPAASSKKK